MVGTVVALVIQMLGGLFLSVYMLATQAVFYEALRLAPAQQVPDEM
jgi:hypothetical protein